MPMSFVRCQFRSSLAALTLLQAASVALADTAISQLDTTVVSASRSERLLQDLPVRTELISQAEIQRTHARSLKDALENVPGLQLREIHGKSGYEATLQGMSSDQLLILIDGMPLAASTGSTVDLSQYSLADVERIEVIKGAASAQYGSSAMGGVINVISRATANGVHASLTHDVGSYGQQNTDQRTGSVALRHTQAQLDMGGEELKVRLTADRRNDRGFDVDSSDWQRQGDQSDRQQLAARLDWTHGVDIYLSIDAQQFKEQDVQWLQQELVGRLPNKFEDIERQRLALTSGFNLAGSAITVKALLENYQSDSHKLNQGYVQAFDERSMELDTQMLSLQIDQPWLTDHQTQLGLDYRKEKLSQFNNGIAEVGDSGTAERSSREIYLQDYYFFGQGHEFVSGVRLQKDSDFSAYLSPKIAVKYQLHNDDDGQFLLRASIGTGYRVPNLKERYYTFDHSSLGYMVMGNPELDPESSISYQFGFWWRSSATQELDVNVFYNDIQDLIQTDTDRYQVVDGIAVYSYKNIANARTYGLETVYRNRLTTALSANVSHTYTLAENTDTQQVLTRRPRHIVRLGADWDISDQFSLSSRLRYQSRELSSSDSSVWSPAWATLDIKASYHADASLTLFGGIDNATDRQRNFTSGTDFGPISGRFIYAGVTLAY